MAYHLSHALQQSVVGRRTKQLRRTWLGEKKLLPASAEQFANSLQQT
jgi:hypothetical protein